MCAMCLCVYVSKAHMCHHLHLLIETVLNLALVGWVGEHSGGGLLVLCHSQGQLKSSV